MAKLPQPPFMPIPGPASTEEAFAHVVHLTEGIDETRAKGNKPFVAGFFSDEHGLLKAARAARVAGYTNLQAWSPYPVHGLDPVLGLKRSLIGRPVFTVVLLGFLFVFIGIAWLMTFDWAIIYGGKPYFTWQLFIVPTLESGLLFGALVNLNACFGACRLVPDPFTTLPDLRLTDDQFCLAISTKEAAVAELENLLRTAGAVDVRPISAEIASGNPIFRIWEDESQEPAHA